MFLERFKVIRVIASEAKQSSLPQTQSDPMEHCSPANKRAIAAAENAAWSQKPLLAMTVNTGF
jgi:hypothetical protein